MVLEVQNDKALILSKYVIEERKYNENRRDVTWETCTLRKYLNGEFLRKFTDEHQRKVAETRIANKKNPWYGAKGGSGTNDRIFLLSIEEVVKYFGNSGQLVNRKSKGQYLIDDNYNSARAATDTGGKACWWWLRSPGLLSIYAANVRDGGDVNVSGLFVNLGGGIRPALWLHL